jgi:hypothetical protein
VGYGTADPNLRLTPAAIQWAYGMDKADRYRARAEECRRMAKQSGLETDRRAWLEVAQLWAFLLHQSRFADAATASSEQFDAQKRQLGTGQEKPDASH